MVKLSVEQIVAATHAQLLQEDIEAHSYERTAVPPTDSDALPPIPHEGKIERPHGTYDDTPDGHEAVTRRVTTDYDHGNHHRARATICHAPPEQAADTR